MRISKKHRSRILFCIAECLLHLAVSLLSRPGGAQTGAVQGFGANQDGQIGDTTNVQRHLPTPAVHISGVKSVSCGADFTLALDSSGVVWAWGWNGYGQLGTGDYRARLEPVAVLAGIRAISAGGNHSLALDYKGQVWAWGDNYEGQLGMGDLLPRLSPSLMTDGHNLAIKAISAGGYHSLLVNQYGALFGCGLNEDGQLAQPDFQVHPNLVFMSYGAVAVAAGGLHTLMLTANHQLYATGNNSVGQLGDETTTTSHRWVLCGGGAVRSMAAGIAHSLCVGLDGRAFGWGSNVEGQLGLGFAGGAFNEPTEIRGAANVKAVVAGGFHTLLLTADGTVLATGRNIEGQLGDGTTTSRSHLAPVKNAQFVGAIAAGWQHSAIWIPATRPMASGGNAYGQLGNGNALQEELPVPMVGIDHVIAVASGNASGYHSLLLRADGTVWACGSNQYGQLGNGAQTLTPNPTPVQVRGPNGAGVLSHIIAIAAGNNHSLALAADGTVYAWGLNNHGQLGLGNRTVTVYPVHVPNMRYIFAMAAGAAHSTLLGLQGQVYSSGWNQYGQLGLPNLTDHLSFEPCAGFVQQIAVAAGSAHCLSLKYTGEIFAWGNNGNGQLALGDNVNRGFPVLQAGTAATAIACGGFHSLCLNAEGRLFGVGMNRYGQLGLGVTLDRNTWSWGSGMAGMCEIAAGNSHTLISNPFGTMLAAGHGAFGELGNGSTHMTKTFGMVSGVPGATKMAGGAGHTLILTTPLIQLAAITVQPTIVKGGAAVTGTITLNGVAGPGGQRVYLAYYSVDQNGVYVNAATGPAYVDVSPTSKTATFTIRTKAVATKTITTINGWLNQSLNTTFTITP